MAETKYNLLTRLLKNIKNVVNPDGSVAGSGGAVAHATYEIDETTQMPTSVVLDMTFDEIVAAEGNVPVVANLGSPEHPYIIVGRVAGVANTGVAVIGIPTESLDDDYSTAVTPFILRDAHGHPAWYAKGNIQK